MTAAQSTLDEPIVTSPGNFKRPLTAVVGGLLVAIASTWWWMAGTERMQHFDVVHKQGAVEVTRTAGSDGVLAEGARVKTGPDSMATVRLGDGSVISVGADTEFEVTRARADKDGEHFVTALRLDAGEITNRVPRGDGRTREVTLLTDSLAVGVRGTIFTVNAEAGESRLSVTEGKVQADGSAGGSALVPVGYGLVVKKGQALTAAVALPSTPSLSAPEAGARIESEQVAFSWQPAGAAAHYQLEIAEDAQFDKVLSRTTVTGSSFVVGTLLPRDGLYHWRVAAVSDSKLRGAWSQAQSFLYKVHHAQGRVALADVNVAAALESFRNGQDGYADELQVLRAKASEQATVWRAEGAETNAMSDDDARALYNFVLGLSPEDSQALVALAYLDLRQGDFSVAQASLGRVLVNEPANVEALVGAAIAAVALGEKDRAIQLTERALEVNPKHENARWLQSSLKEGARFLGVMEANAITANPRS